MKTRKMHEVARFSERELAIISEAFMTGRIYSNSGEKESPMEIKNKLIENCAKALDHFDAQSLDNQEFLLGLSDVKMLLAKQRSLCAEQEIFGKDTMADCYCEVNYENICNAPEPEILIKLKENK